MKLLLILNTPPPYWGTTIMNKYLLDTLEEKHIEHIHLRIETNKKLQELGKLQMNKLSSAFRIVKGIIAHRKEYKTAYLVMSVEGFAFYRHSFFIFLLLILNKKCILHLRALGFRNKKGLGRSITSYLFKRSYLIQHSRFNSFDIDAYQSKEVFFVPNGWSDSYQKFASQIETRRAKTNGLVNIIFLSNLIADKGLFTVIESIRALSQYPGYKMPDVKWNFVGNWQSEMVEERFNKYVKENKLEAYIGHVGPLYDDKKYALLAKMDVLAFPTFYKHETWGNVILEAMMFKIPVISTRYVAIPEMVKDGITGYLIDKEDPVALAEKLKILIDRPDLRCAMGAAGRELYLEKFRIETFKSNITEVLSSIDKK